MRPLLLLPLVVVMSACAHQPLRFLDTAEDAARVGLGPTVEVREDGRRSRAGTDDYEWWYLDGVSADGTVVVIVFSDNWLPGSHRRAVTIELTRPGRPPVKKAFFTNEPGAFSTAQADVRIGKSRFAGNLEHYTIELDPADFDGVGCSLTLARRTPSYRPGLGMVASGDDFFGWIVAVPEGALRGTVTVGGERIELDGSGYHDHNWGNIEPWALMRNWWWGRAEVDGYTVVMSEMRPARGRGEKALPLLFVAGPGRTIADVHGDAAIFVETSVEPNDDPSHPEAKARAVSISAPGVKATFTREGAPLTSLDLLPAKGFVRFVAELAGRSPWYTRWKSVLTLDAEGAPASGKGTIEFMDLD